LRSSPRLRRRRRRTTHCRAADATAAYSAVVEAVKYAEEAAKQYCRAKAKAGK